MSIASGTLLGRYEIHSMLGEGGMGEVYLAQDTKLDRQIALKILPEDLANDAERMQRFVREAKSASALNHPNIITIYEIGEFDSTHFIATEYIEGDELRSIRAWLKIRENYPNANSNYLFLSERGLLMRQAISYLVEQIGKRAKLGFKVNPHMLRHSTGYYLEAVLKLETKEI